MEFKNAKELLELCRQQGCPISELMRRREWTQGETTEEAVNRRMERVLEIMRQSATIPLERPVRSMGGLIGGEARQLADHAAGAGGICGPVLQRAVTYAMAVLEVNASMGLIVAALLGTSFSRLPIIGPYISLIFSILGAIVGAKVALNKRTDIVSFFNRIWFSSRVKESSKKTASHVSRTHKLLDTSVLIDGRILEIIRLGFLEGTIIIPKFVLEELQKIADSADTLKRNRGRRGLDIVQEIKDLKNVSIEIVDKDFDDLTEVDAKLVRLAAQMKGVLATNDFNLSKVAKIQGVPVLNVNDLANALKQAVLPGEELRIFLAKEGKEQGQAIGYLDDGTMVVVENGKRSVNQTVPVTVTSVLQTSAGRMIFAKMK